MAKQTPLINNFTAGELSPKVDVRSDIQKYFNGCRTMENFYPLIEGAAKRMPGTKFIASIVRPSESSSPSVSPVLPGELYFIQWHPTYGTHLHRITLSTFTDDPGPVLSSGISGYNTQDHAIIDPDNNWYYMGGVLGGVSLRLVVRISLPNRDVVSSIDLTAYGCGKPNWLTCDRYNRILYVITTGGDVTGDQMIFKIDMETFTVIDSATIDPVIGISSLIMDDTNGYIYACSGQRAASIRVSDFDITIGDAYSPIMTLNNGCIDIANGYGYFSGGTLTTGRIARLNLATLEVDTLLLSELGTMNSLAIDPENGMLYTNMSPLGVNPGIIYKIALSSFTLNASASLDDDSRQYIIIDQENQKLYLGGGSISEDTIIKVDCNTLLIEDSLDWEDEGQLPVIEYQNTV